MADNNTDYSVPGLKVCKLIFVEGTSNKNKYYNMFQQPDGTYKVVYGRVQSTGVELTNPMNLWDSTVRSKVKKGYSDMTHLHKEIVVEEVKETSKKSKIVDIANSLVRDFINKLQAFANKSVQQNYTISSAAVTQAMVDEAQVTINEINVILTLKGDVKKVNTLLLKLYTIIPRSMRQVANHLVQSLDDNNAYQKAQKLIATEQQELDVMAGQVAMETKQKKQVDEVSNPEETKKQLDLLDTLGLEITPVDNKEVEMIKTLMGPNANQFRKAFKVINKKTETLYQSNLKSAKNKKTELFWHGSRNENIFSILQSGLLIRPSGAVHSGSMWDDGIYGADSFQKSYGYSSGRNSYWANGTSDVAYLMLFDFHVGNQLHMERHDSSCYTISKRCKSQGFDSVYAHKGVDLRNNEYIVYNPCQVTMKYIIEVS